jgi:hypothetical protein
MAGLVPAINVFKVEQTGVDAGVEAGMTAQYGEE